MTIPILICRFRKAFESDEELESLKRDLQGNLNIGSLSVLPCPHTPPCKPLTEEEWTELERKIE
jgi:hypothetical protein